MYSPLLRILHVAIVLVPKTAPGVGTMVSSCAWGLVCLNFAQSCPTLWPHGLEPSVHGDSLGNNTGVGCHALLQQMFPIQGLNPGLLNCRQIPYCLSHQGSPGVQFSSVAQSCPILCNPMDCSTPGFCSRLPCPSPTPRVYSHSCPLSQWCHLTISTCYPLLLPPSIIPSIRVFSNESGSSHQVAKY